MWPTSFPCPRLRAPTSARQCPLRSHRSSTATPIPSASSASIPLRAPAAAIITSSPPSPTSSGVPGACSPAAGRPNAAAGALTRAAPATLPLPQAQQPLEQQQQRQHGAHPQPRQLVGTAVVGSGDGAPQQIQQMQRGGGGGGGCTRRTAALALAAAAAAAASGGAGGAALAAAPAAGGSGRFSAQATSAAGQQQRDDGGGAAAGGGGDAARPPRRRTWPPVSTVPLAKGLRISKVIRGCWQLSGRHKGDQLSDRTAGGEAVTDLAAFHQAGITTLDLADNYGPAELLAGQYLRLYDGPLSASTTIATKLSYLSEEEMSGVSRTMVEYAVRRSLVRLGRQRLDLLQLQWAEPVRNRRWLDVLKWLADLREEGLIGHIGVCNVAVPQLAQAVDAGVGLVSNQVQFSLIDRRPQLYLQKAAASYGIKLLAYGTVAGGLLADKYYGVPASKVRLDTASKQKYGLVLRQAGGGGYGVDGGGNGGGGGGWDWMQEVLEAARTVGQRHGVSASAVATAWVLHQQQVAAAIVGARNVRHIRDMQAACALQLDEVDLLDLDAVWEGVPQPPTSDVYVWERGGEW